MKPEYSMGGELYGGEYLIIWKQFHIFFEKEELRLAVRGLQNMW
jgi:hypothetical protein